MAENLTLRQQVEREILENMPNANKDQVAEALHEHAKETGAVMFEKVIGKDSINCN